MRLSREQIKQIVTAFHSGEGALEIATRFGIDRSTVAYHVEKYDDAYAMGESFYSTLKVETQYECIHPSMVCAVCKKRTDTLMRAERLLIRQLRAEIAQLKGGEESGAV